MSDVLSNDDLDALAAEYVLGTLDPEERKGAAALLEVDHAFRGTVRIWERRLSELHLMVEPVEPDAKILERIKAKLGDVPQSAPEAEPLPEPAEPDATSETKAAEGEAAEAKPAEAEGAVPDAEGTVPAVAEAEASDAESKAPTLVPEETPARPPEPPLRPTAVPPLLRRGGMVTEMPKRANARGWKISTVLTTLIALLLAALIGAWRYFPERLPPPLRATKVLNLPEPPPPPLPLPPPRRSPPPTFDE